MKLSRFRPAFIALLCSAGFLHADIVVLKDGKRLEGTITDEKPDKIHMRYKLTAKIWDDKDIPRTDIVEIIKQKPEEVEMIELRKELPTSDLMSAEKHENLIQDRLRPFVNRYPGSPEAAEAEKMIAQLQEEKERVVAGGIKMEGKWLTPEEAKAQTYNIKAYEIYAQIHTKAVAKDYAGALKEFEKMSPSQIGYYGQQAPTGYTLSPYYPKAVEEIVAVLTNYQAQVEQMIKDQPTLTKMREEGLKKLIEPDLSRTKSAIERDKEQWKSSYDAERKTSKWFTPYKYDLASLKALSTSIIAEKTRLKAIDLAKITKLNEIIGRIMQVMPKAGKDGEALQTMRNAIVEGQEAVAGVDQQAQLQYNQAFQAYSQYYMMFVQQLTALSAQAAVVPGAATPGGSAAIGGTATPGMDDRVAAALAAAGGAPAPAAGTAPAQQQPGAAVMPQAGYPAQQQQPGAVPVQGAVPPGAAVQPGTVVPPQGYPQAQAPYGQVLPQAQAPVPAAEEAPPAGLSTNTMILIGIGVVVLVLVVAMSGGKKKKAE